MRFGLLFYLFVSAGCLAHPSTQKGKSKHNVKIHAIRLKPGEDLKQSIASYVKINNIQAGWIATCAGSLTAYKIRFANKSTIDTGVGHFEIVSLSGTLSINGSHLHIAIADSTGKTTGGHLSDGCIIYTTAEIVIQETDRFVFKREKDGTTEWEELQIMKAIKD